jgi:DNA polymerase III epsilon subunit-like protein
MPAATQRTVYFDIETGGLNPKRHPIIQIAAIAVTDRLEPIEAFEAKIRFDERDANRNSLRKNHYHPGVWAKEALEPREAVKSFGEFLRRHATITLLSSSGKPYQVAQLAAHNAAFDGAFLQSWYERLRTFLPARCQVLDSLQLAMWFFQLNTNEPPPADFKLATLCRHFGVDFHAAIAHDALADVSATVRLCQEIRRRSHGFDPLSPVRRTNGTLSDTESGQIDQPFTTG